MFTKLKLQIDFSNTMDVDGKGYLLEEYRLYITVLDKDERFESDKTGVTYSHNGSNTFVIKSRWDERMGGILYNGLLIPVMDRMGIEYCKTFKDDMERYYYLRKLYIAIDEWANYWWGFIYDSKSEIVVKDNIWEITCDTIYNGSMEYLESEYI